MSASPQPATAPAPPIRSPPTVRTPPASISHPPTPAAGAPPNARASPTLVPNGISAPAAESPAALASMLSKSYRDNDILRTELHQQKRVVAKLERTVTALTELVEGAQRASAKNSSPPGAAAGGTPNGSKPLHDLPEYALKVVTECETRIERAEIARDEADARLRAVQDAWSELERYLGTLAVRAADARTNFSRLVAEGGGPMVHLPPGQLPAMLQQAMQNGPDSVRHLNPLPRPSSSLPLHRSGGSTHVFPSLPPPPVPTSSRVRPRADSVDGAAYAGVLSGPGGPPPSKRLRSDRERSDRDRDVMDRSARYSLSPSHSPHPAYLVNGSADRAAVHHASAAVPTLHPYYGAQQQQQQQPPYRPRDDVRYADGTTLPPYAASERHSRSRHRGRSVSHSRSQSRSRSRGSSMSLDEMLLEATTGDDGRPTDMPGAPRHPLAHPSDFRVRHRSQSPDRREYLAVPHHHRAHSHSRGSPSVSHVHQLHPSAAASGPGVSPPGAGALSPSGPGVPGGTHPIAGQPMPTQIQTHIFAPPVMGAPVKKPKIGGQGSIGNLGPNGSVITLGPTGSVISGPSAMGGGSFPPTNTLGQRICRHCGQPGRYKEGKCVEKWGPGPEGPGTVCDRCRKKMKRVERRGTLDSQHLTHPGLAHHMSHSQPAAVHPSSHHSSSMLNGRLPSSSDRSIHRQDTLPLTHPSSQSRVTLGPAGTHIIPTSSFRHERESDPHTRPASPHGAYSRSGAPRAPTPPYIATLPGSSVDEDMYDAERAARHKVRSRVQSISRSHSRERRSNGHVSSVSPPMRTNGVAAGSPRGSVSSRGSGSGTKSRSDVDADADADADADVDADADMDAEAEAEAELLEAVDAAEANNATDEEWLKKEE
ncbi:hypothetical protein OBBRIDRAFT_807738 [Obba rivulosa]|uniref:Uncharacterized protein n=1 Tax=Obba rivulosa TaxID=1052685 RepID=A0A8E2AND3_9APHY|nr:hypothetical protein OBBRIDRAFT_807738 [Obba rivulosa]